MAKNNSYLKFEGTLGGLTYYEKDGESLVKVQSRISKSRIERDPAFKRTRENMMEFGASAKASKALRSALSTVVKIMGDTYLASRLTGVMRRILNNGTGLRGQRNINISPNALLLENFELNKIDTLSSQFFAPYDKPSLNADRDIITWVVPDFNTDSSINKPEGATHCKLVLAAGLLSDYQYEPALRGYEPVNADENAIGSAIYSPGIPLVGMVGSDTTLVVDLGLATPVVATSATIAGVGIVFYQEINGMLFELSSGNAMRIATVG